MKRTFLALMLVFTGLFSQAQSLDDIILMIKLTQYDKAKPDLDKYMSNEKNAAKAPGWYYKAFLYSNLARQANKSAAEAKQLNDDAFAAIKKYMELDSKAQLTTEENNSTIYNLYYSLYDQGVKMYTAKDYAASCDFFKRTLDVHDYIYGRNLNGPNGLKFSAHDTDIVWNLAVLSNELKRKDDALEYYKRIADADLPDEKYAEAYDELAKKYRQEGNKELFSKYVSRAKKHYPTDPYWEAIEVEYAVKGLEGDELFKAYEGLLASHPNSYMVNFNYGYELEKYIYSQDAKGKDISALKKKIPELFKKAISIKSTIDANMLLANYYYNSSFDAMDEANKIKSTKPDDVKKKNELIASSKTTLLESQPYAEKAIDLYEQLKEYKSSDKANYKQVLDVLSAVWKQKGDAKKSDEYAKRKDAVDKL
jgi:tetratricopeptide (TPR) repeat protein